ncbi:MAG TPA: response regulator [Bryobacteraceae bacterium]|nr:response regulator [Bryobacteraceae bacterium]
MSRILVADDDDVQLELRRTVLEAYGYEVILAVSPSAALDHVRQGCDLVMMDLRFSNCEGVADACEGLALIRRIRETGSKVPVLVLCGWPDDLYGRPEEKLVSRVMMKPTPTHTLLATISELVG